MGNVSSVVVLGLGKVGELVARLLHRSAFEVVGTDLSGRAGAMPFPIVELDVADADAVAERPRGLRRRHLLVAAAERAAGRPIKDTVGVSASGRIRQTAHRAPVVTRLFGLPDGGSVQLQVPGSFFE